MGSRRAKGQAMSRNLRHKRRAKRCRDLASHAIRNPSGYNVGYDQERDAMHMVRAGGYSLNLGDFWPAELKAKP